MKEKRKLKLKKFYFHPITVFIFLTFLVLILSWFLSLFEVQATYNVINSSTNELEPTLVSVQNLLSYKGVGVLIGDVGKNLYNTGHICMIILSLIGIAIAEATGLIETFSKRYLRKMPRFVLTFLVIFLASISSLINEVGYAILIPLAALVYFICNRNPIAGVVTAFCGVAFGSGVSLFVGSTELSLIKYTQDAASLIDKGTHIALTSNLIFIIAASIILSIVGTIIMDKIIEPKIGKYKREEEFSKTEQYRIITEEDEQQEIARKKREKKGLRWALITTIIMIAIYAYALIPNLPLSGMLLDLDEKIYLNQLFDNSSYFKSSFSYLISLIFIISGIAYALGAKSVKNDKELIENASKSFSNIGVLIILILVTTKFVTVFEESNIGLVLTAWLVNLIETLKFSGILLIVVSLLLIALANLFVPNTANKWLIFSPVVVPMFMQSNISPQFAQIVMRAGDSMTKGITPLLASFAIYIAYLNIYNLHKERPYTIKKSLKIVTPYFLLISVTWIVLVLGWYLIGLPIGPGVFPTL